MRILIPHPPGPLLLQEKGVEKNLGEYPQTPIREAQPLWTLRCLQRGFHKGRSPFGGSLGVPPNSPKNGGYKGLKESFL